VIGELWYAFTVSREAASIPGGKVASLRNMRQSETQMDGTDNTMGAKLKTKWQENDAYMWST